MSTLDIKKHFKKTILVYSIATIVAIAVDRIYTIFGHGVFSGYMSLMFLYPFIGGVLFFLLLGLFAAKIKRHPGYRVAYNLYNSGIALLTVVSFMKGVFEIAGTSSSYTAYYYFLGGFFIVFAFVYLAIVKGDTAAVY